MEVTSREEFAINAWKGFGDQRAKLPAPEGSALHAVGMVPASMESQGMEPVSVTATQSMVSGKGSVAPSVSMATTELNAICFVTALAMEAVSSLP